MGVSPPDPPKKILVVDNERAVRELLGLVLSERGYVVYPAAAAEEAVDLCRQHQPRLALLEPDLPGVAALQLLKELQSACPAIRICVMSGADYQTAEQWYQAGVAHVFSKPFALDQLVRILDGIRDTPEQRA